MINMKKRVCIACFLGVAIILLASCSKDSSVSSIVSAETVFTADLPNAKDADQEDNDYLVTREMVEMLLREDSESEGSSAAIIPYPSEDNPLKVSFIALRNLAAFFLAVAAL